MGSCSSTCERASALPMPAAHSAAAMGRLDDAGTSRARVSSATSSATSSSSSDATAAWAAKDDALEAAAAGRRARGLPCNGDDDDRRDAGDMAECSCASAELRR